MHGLAGLGSQHAAPGLQPQHLAKVRCTLIMSSITTVTVPLV
jgi:hypothetical protein